MKDFSNETKATRRNAVLKVILKRYSFIVWLPLLLYSFNFIGKNIIKFSGEKCSEILSIDIITNIFVGVIFLGFIIFLVIIIGVIVYLFISYFKERTLFKDIKLLFFYILKIPVKLYKRIKDEKRRFQNAVENQISKDSNKNLGGDIDN